MSAYTANLRSRRGMTTSDIIVLLVVLVLVAAVMIPVGFPRREGCTLRRSCQSNLKECAIALQTYWNDYDGHLPSSALVSRSKTWNRRDFTMFASGVGVYPPGISVDPRRSPATWSQVLYSSIKSKDTMFCPDDDSDHKPLAGAEAYDLSRHQVSYYWKAAIDKAWYGVGCKKPCRRESDFGYQADQVILYERCGFHTHAEEGLKNGVQINVAYLDTHVRSISLVNSLPADGDKWVTSPTAPGEPAYFNFDNDQKKSQSNPPPRARTTYTDPSRYADMLP